MEQMYKNEKNTSLSVAMWLATDNYDHNPNENVISVTTIIKPIKQILLATRAAITGVIAPEEVSNLVASRMGTAFHDSIEAAWLGDYAKTLAKLGYPKGVVKLVRVNPSKQDLLDNPDIIPVYLERRSQKTLDGLTISGKFDFVGEGRVEDFKSTSTYSYTHATNTEKYILQGSIYRWLNQDIITDDSMAIQFIFTDWSVKKAMSDKSYPQSRVLEMKLPLMSVVETERYLRNKVKQIMTLGDAPEEDIPSCTDEELWRSAPQFKYYANPQKLGRATKNFDTSYEANAHMVGKAKGVVIEKKGEARACKYCSAFNVCTQKDAYILDGSLIVS